MLVRNDVLECFVLGYALEITCDGLGRPVSIGPLWLAAKDKCGECSVEEVLDALYNVQRDHAELYKFVPLGGGSQRVSFERVRNTPRWTDFFTRGEFRIKVLPGGRLRFQRLLAQLQESVALPA